MRNEGKTATPRQPGTAGSVQPPESRAGAMPALVPGSQLLFRIPEAMEMLSLSRSVMYKQLRSGRIRSVGQGRARRIPASALLEYIDLLEREAVKRHAAAKKLAIAGSPRATLAHAADQEGSQ
jgi:excisionase family DNA binding protein